MKLAIKVLKTAQNNLAPSKHSAHVYGDGELWDEYADAIKALEAALEAHKALAKQSDSVEQRSVSEHTGEPVAWKLLEELPPPIDQALDDVSVSSRRRVLVTNNINATNRMGQPSHVWFVSPQRVKKGEWVGFTDSMQKVEALTHWLDPFDTTPQQRKPLTDEQIWQLVNDCTIGGDLHADKFARAIEAAHGIKETV